MRGHEVTVRFMAVTILVGVLMLPIVIGVVWRATRQVARNAPELTEEQWKRSAVWWVEFLRELKKGAWLEPPLKGIEGEDSTSVRQTKEAV